MQRSIVLKLWLVFTALQASLIVPFAGAGNRLLVDYYRTQALAPLVLHAHSIADMVGRNGTRADLVSTMADMVSAEVAIVSQSEPEPSFPGIPVGELPQAVLAAITSGLDAGLEMQTSDRRTYLIAVAPISTDTPRQSVVLLARAEPIRVALQAAQIWLGTGLGMALILASVLGWFVSRWLVRPLLEMERATHTLAEGDYDIHLDVPGQDEVGLLARGINVLANRLATYEKTRREFLANVAHELRTPLTYIRGYSQALIEDLPRSDADRAKYQQAIHEESLRVGDLVDDLMDLAELDDGAIALQPVAVRPSNLLAQAILTVRPRAEERGIVMEVNLQPSLPHVWVDPMRVSQVLLNLLDNALRHTPQGGEVLIGADLLLHQVKFTIYNSGETIPEEKLNRIFERFYKADPSRKQGGRGLGLAIAALLVHLHGGKMGAMNVMQGGVQVWFTLPIAGASGALGSGVATPTS